VLTFELLLGLFAFCLALALVARRIGVPLAVALVLGGMAIAFLPGLPHIAFEPELALALFLPPLLQLSAYRTDWPAFRTNLRPILLLATGAVLFTAAVVACVAKWLIPDLPWGAAIALGAIVAPPDAVAAAAVLRDLRPPKRIATVLEGESLLNDAASLVLYRFAVGATIAGTFDLKEGALAFLLSAVGGTLVGYAIGRLAMWIFSRIDETLHDITVSVLAGFAAYFAAEAVHASGVLGVVACGLVLGTHQHQAFTAHTRLASGAVWSFLEFALTSLVFMLIGMQLRGIIDRLPSYAPAQLATLALATSGALILSRFAWIMPMTWIPRLLSRRLRERDPAPPASHLVVISWAGMRGVVSLAAALALPMRFPGRDIIIFLAFCTILATLVVQGTTLGPLIRRLGLTRPDNDGVDPRQVTLRRHVAEAALNAVEEQTVDDDRDPAATELVAHYRDRAQQAARLDDGAEPEANRAAAQLTLRLTAVEAARSKLAARRQDHDDDAALGLMTELDLEEEQIRRELIALSQPAPRQR
jgi:CPA1 family monovalent cation:H+ antiporter